MTAQDRSRLRVAYERALHRAERAAWYGDHAGAVIAACDARRIARRLDADRMTASADR